MTVIPVLDIVSLFEGLGYIGIFLISMFGTMTIIFPIPYLITIYIMAASKAYNPIILGIIGGLGATIGEITLYILARMGRIALSDKKLRELDSIRDYLDKYGWIAVFIFAATPLPDDILYPFLGLIKYDATKLFISCFLGKALLTGVVAYAGLLSIDILDYMVGESLYSGIIMLIIIIILVIIVLKIDWSKFVMIGGNKK